MPPKITIPNFPGTFTIYWTAPDVIKAITTTLATDRELCFRLSRSRQSYTPLSLNCITDLDVDTACETIMLMHRT